MSNHPKSAFSIMILTLVAATEAWPFQVAVNRHGGTALQKTAYVYPGGHYALETTSGRPTLLRSFFMACGVKARPLVSAQADHGVTTTKEGIVAICGVKDQPVTELCTRPIRDSEVWTRS